ncbi:MAG TPA: hypothetical protein VF692_11190 [Pyrinomonadaceae bacterium]
MLGHLNSMGDCLFATVIARQIKEVDFPDCHLTWAINSKCKQVVELNPHIDEIWEISTEKAMSSVEEWNDFVSQAEKRKERGDFDEIFYTQIAGDNWTNYDGGIRSSTYNNYPRAISVPHQPIIRLSEREIENVARFAEKHRLAAFRQVILIECGPDSFDAALDLQSAYDFAQTITNENKDVAVVLSSNKRIASTEPNIIDASELSFRENAELIKYCDLFIGCASGISWLATTDWAKKINTVLVINQQHFVFPSMIYDHEYLNLLTDHIIEIKSDADSIVKLKNCFDAISNGEFSEARKTFNEKIEPGNFLFLFYQLESALGKLNFGKFASCFKRVFKRNGLRIIFNAGFRKVFWDLQLKSLNKALELVGLKKKTILIK